MTDPFVGTLIFFRFIPDRSVQGASVYNSLGASGTSVVCLKCCQKREEIKEAMPVLLRRRWTEDRHYRDTLCRKSSDYPESIDFPDPVTRSPLSQEQGRSGETRPPCKSWLPKTLRSKCTPIETGPDHYLRHGGVASKIIVDRLLREFSVGANFGKPQVAIKETIRKASREVRFVRQTVVAASMVMFGSSSNRTAGRRFEFVDAVQGGSISA